MASHSRFLLLGAVALGLAAPALAQPYGGAPLLKVHAVAARSQGFWISAPDLVRTSAGARTHGEVCRTAALPATAPHVVSVERLDAAGALLDDATAPLVGNLTNRPGHGCAYYDLETGWRLDASDTVRVAAS